LTSTAACAFMASSNQSKVFNGVFVLLSALTAPGIHASF
jgi:hypothetical protein